MDKLLHMWRDRQGNEATVEELVKIIEGKKEFTAIVQQLLKLTE